MMGRAKLLSLALLAIACDSGTKAAAPDGDELPVTVAKAPALQPAAPAPPGVEPAQRVVDWTIPRRAMDEFIAAVLAKDRERVLACFSRGRPFSFGDPGAAGKSASFRFADLETGLKPGGDWVSAMFGGENDPNFRDYIVDTHLKEWPEVKPLTFAPPGMEPFVSVRWRKEGNRYVIDRLVMP